GHRMSGQRVDVKVVMLGKEFVGKTSLVERYVHNRFLNGPYQNTIGAAFVAKLIHVGEKVITLGIWDTAGSERYESMSRIYYRGARAAVVCFEIKAKLFETSSKTGQNVDELFQIVAEDYVNVTAFQVMTEGNAVNLAAKKKPTYFFGCCHQ
ncbi:hypothetical protein scyTo_0019415, partial [Scyliorhinus torazame]|nr:hypothetical protein [Scyliorhinus torazame]